MKLSLFSSEIFWGALLILIGISIIIKTFFGIDIPIIRTFTALFLIYLGFALITDIGSTKKYITFDKQTIFPEQAENSYKIRFGKGIIDLTHLHNLDLHKTVNVDVMFGTSVVRIPKDTPTKITIHANFGNAVLPDGTQISSGTYTYKTNTKDEKYFLDIEAKVIFGNLKIKIKE